MPVSEATYERVALEDPEGKWELVCGRLRSKPCMMLEHNRTIRRLTSSLLLQLDLQTYTISTESARLRISSGDHFVPDLCVIPLAYEQRKAIEEPQRLEVYDEPLPLVVAVWSPSTGVYDVETKLRQYQLRGDQEIWRIHPYEKTLTAWQLQPDGSYRETLYRSGHVQPIALPDVRVELASLFA